jgi:hypothetical protein
MYSNGTLEASELRAAIGLYQDMGDQLVDALQCIRAKLQIEDKVA